MLHRKCGTRVRMQYFCPYDHEVVQRTETIKGYEHARDQFVQFTEEELKKMESERSDQLEIVEFVPEESVDLLYVENSQYVGPAKGGDRAYKLLADSMERTRRAAVGRYGGRGREQLVILRPYRGGLVMHEVYYGDEVRPIEEVDFPRHMSFAEAEVELAERLIEELSVDEFDPTKYHDSYRERVLTAVEQKVAGREIAVPPERPQAQIVDLFEALRRSLSERPPRRAEERSGAQAAEEEEQAPVSQARPSAAERPAARRRPGDDRTGTR
jgi:DNA end-binding protein Ku